MYRNIQSLIDQASKNFKDNKAFSLKSGFRTKVYTFRDIENYVKRFPSFFRKHDIKKGDKIISLSLNRPEYSTLILGRIWSGITIVPIDYRTNEETIHKFIKKTKPEAVFTSKIFKNLFEGTHIKLFFFEDLLTELKEFDEHPHIEVDENDTAAILFTSGTTGEPKGTIISYKNVFASIKNVREAFPLPRNLRILSILPLSHALEMFGGMMTAYSFGCHIHYIERVNSITIVSSLKRYKIQAMAVVPQMLRLILQNIERRVEEDKMLEKWNKAHKIAPYLPLKSRRLLFKKFHESFGGKFEFFVCGSAPLETKIAEVWQNMGVKIIEGYGASETTGFVSSNNLKRNHLGSVGKLFPRMEAKLDESGELLVKGDNIVSGYFENPEQTEATFIDGWFKTGDIVKIVNNIITITGRDKFKIVLPDGKKVYPEDIEKKLNNNKYVIDSTVFGIKGEEGEMVHAELILKNPHKLNEVIEEVNKTLNAHEQIMDSGIFPEKDFPRTKTLKVDREAVRQIVVDRKTNNKTAEKKDGDHDDQVIKILRDVSGKKNINMHGNTTLASDLKLDSLKRIELLALIEEELGISVNETTITPQTTIADLRALIKNGKPVTIGDGIKISDFRFSPIFGNLRVLLQHTIVFPLCRFVAKMEIVHPENLKLIKTPQLFIFNHVGIHDIVQHLSTLPPEIRKKTAIAATREIWTDKTPAFERILATSLGNAFPFVKAEEGNGAMKGNFERVGEILDHGFNIFISPEGNISKTGELLPFHTGAGYIAVEMGVPVTVFKLKGWFELWPDEPSRKLNLFWPKKFGKIQVVVSEPITFEPGTSYEEATQILRNKMLEL